MTTSVNHHVGLRVADIERSIRFYREALDGQLRTQIMEYGPPDAAQIMNGPEDLRFRVCLIGFDEGTIELFELGEPYRQTRPIPAIEGGIIHYAFRVDNVEAALERVERAGGGRFWTQFREIGPGVRAFYATDPDGHVLELINLGIDDLVDLLNARTRAAQGSPEGSG
jgi:catechol 2,3-dioxygenase-like lactoylglutathione lyase family enzyme